MGRSLRAFFLIVMLVGCGGGSHDYLPAGFRNQTQHTDNDLWAIWTSAQRSVAQRVDLNPLQRLVAHAAPNILPGDPRALHLMPKNILVAAEPDVSSNTLFSNTGVRRTDPTGLIACPQPCNVRYAPAYSFYRQALTKYAASWESEDDNFATILQYEFENHILQALGYDMKWR